MICDYYCSLLLNILNRHYLNLIVQINFTDNLNNFHNEIQLVLLHKFLIKFFF